MTDKPKNCGNCCWFSDGFAPAKPDWCYFYGIEAPGSCNDGWRKSLRDEPLGDSPVKLFDLKNIAPDLTG